MSYECEILSDRSQTTVRTCASQFLLDKENKIHFTKWLVPLCIETHVIQLATECDIAPFPKKTVSANCFELKDVALMSKA